MPDRSVSPTVTWPDADALAVTRVGPCTRPTPLRTRDERLIDDDERVLLPSTRRELEAVAAGQPPPAFEAAGPRAAIHFDPATTSAGIVTCGGLCPGLNNVVRSIVLRLHYAYGVKRILGFRYGYAGLDPTSGLAPMPLLPATVEQWHEHGGTALGSSRGPHNVPGMVDELVRRDVQLLFVLGGDGGLRGAHALHAEIARRELPIAVVGVPKTIDNDLMWTWRSFGFATAVEAARDVLRAAHVEARAAWNGIGLVKLMGRQSGFIAAHATLASSEANFCLVPEVPFTLHGSGGLLEVLERRLAEKHHAVLAVAEGAGQDLMPLPEGRMVDASGNVKLKDVGLFLRDAIAHHFRTRGIDVTIRYIDPSYIIRSLPANSMDAQYCLVLGQHAVHAAMAGRTDVIVGAWANRFVHVPIPLAVRERRMLDPHGEEWQRVLEATGQPPLVGRA
jgi:6-phosphofructokinase 1